MKKFLSFTVLCLVSILLIACSGTKQETTQTSLSSMPSIEGVAYYGDIPQAPKRVVSLNFANTGYLLKLGFSVVGATSYDLANPAFSSYLEETQAVTSEDLEAIAALEPDLIVTGSTDTNIEQLSEIAPTISIEYSKHSYKDTLAVFGQIFHQEKLATEWTSQWDQAIETAGKDMKALTGDAASFTIMGYLGADLYVFGQNWGRGGEIIYQELGYAAPQSVQDDVFEAGYLAVSTEVLSQYAGDYIIMANEDSSAASNLYETDVWQNLAAVQDGHLIQLDAKSFIFNDPISLEYQLGILHDAILALQ
ncbi:TPA: ABC transporter substrate-binding protein [Streptococcus suis]